MTPSKAAIRRVSLMQIIVAESACTAGRVFGGELVRAISADGHVQRLVLAFKAQETLLQVSPESQQGGARMLLLFEGMEPCVGEPSGEDVNWQVLLSCRMGQHSEPIDFLDSVIGNGNAADRGAVTVQEDVATCVRQRFQDAVRRVRVTNVHAEIEVALRIEPVEIIKALGDLFVSEAPLGAGLSRSGADGVGLDQRERRTIV